MERIKFSKQSKTLMYLFLIVGIILLIYSILNVYNSISNGAGLLSGHHHFISFISLVVQIILGFTFIFLWYSNGKYHKYYIEWDDVKLRYRLPSSPRTQTITLSDIQDADIKSRNLELNLKNTGTKIINLDGIDYDDLQKLKEQFL